MNKEILEFDVLGTRVKFTPHTNERVSSDKIVNLVKEKMMNYKIRLPHLSDKDIAVLVALEFAQKSLELAEDYKINLDSLESSINEALGQLDSSEKKVQ